MRWSFNFWLEWNKSIGIGPKTILAWFVGIGPKLFLILNLGLGFLAALIKDRVTKLDVGFTSMPCPSMLPGCILRKKMLPALLEFYKLVSVMIDSWKDLVIFFALQFFSNLKLVSE